MSTTQVDAAQQRAQGRDSLKPGSIRMFLSDGSPDGIRIVDKSNWVGRAIVANRPQLPDALKRAELSRPGVYVLVGPHEAGGASLYVGEADVLSRRLKDHVKRDFWTWFVAFTSVDESLNKASIRFLESRLVALARRARRWRVENETTPSEPPLSEPDRADVDAFLDDMLVIYRLLGIDAFDRSVMGDLGAASDPEFVLSVATAAGRARLSAEGLLVLKGSRARQEVQPSAFAHQVETRRRLVEQGVLVPDGDALRFTQDFMFDSPSLAASVLTGGSANGRTQWKTADGQTLREFQESQLSEFSL